MKIKFTRNVLVAAEHFGTGDAADLPDDLAYKLIRMGKAVPMTTVPAEPEIQTNDPEIEHRDPQPAHSGRRKKSHS